MIKPANTARDSKVGQKRQPKEPENKEQESAHQCQGQGIFHPQRIAYGSKTDEQRTQDRGNGGIRASHDMTRAGENGEYSQWNDARIEAEDRRQPGHLGVSDIERDDQRRQGDAARDFVGQICPRGSF